MNPAKVTDLDYINFLVASPKVVSCTEAARCQPLQPKRPAHDALTRLLHRLEPDPTPLWNEAQQHVRRDIGILIVDDTTLDKPYATHIELVHRHWSGKHHRVVHGINLVTVLWSDGNHCVPCDYRFFDKPNDALTKHDHFQAMLTTAHTRGFTPRVVAFDSWYSSLANLKHVRSLGWHWFTQLKSNRQVDPDRTGNRAVSDVASTAAGSVVYLKGYGLIKVFRIDTPDGDTEYWATDVVTLTPLERARLAGQIWTIEVHHRGGCPLGEAVLWGGALPGAECAGAAQPHRLGDPGLSAAGTPPHPHRHQLVRDQDEHHSLGAPNVPVVAQPNPGWIGSEPVNCVTPKLSTRRRPFSTHSRGRLS